MQIFIIVILSGITVIAGITFARGPPLGAVHVAATLPSPAAWSVVALTRRGRFSGVWGGGWGREDRP